MNLEAFRQAVMSASYDPSSTAATQFTEILQVLSMHMARSDSLPDSAIEEITKMVNSLPMLRRRATDGDAGGKPQVLLVEGFGSGASNLAASLGQFAIPVAALKLEHVGSATTQELCSVSTVIVGHRVLQTPQLGDLQALLEGISQLSSEPPAVVLACDESLAVSYTHL